MKAATGQMFDIDEDGNVTPVKDAPPAAAEKPSFLEEAGSRVKNFVTSLAAPPTLHDVGQSFVDLGKGAARANDFAARAIVHPVDTFGDGKAGAVVREGMRGVNSNIPLANLAVEHMGGPAENSPEDEAKAPGAREFGAIAGAPVAGLEGEIAAKAAPAAASAVRSAGKAAEERGVTRVLDRLEEKTNKKARAGIQSDPVERLVREEPEVAKAAGDDRKLQEALGRVRDKAGAELAHIYSSSAPEIDPAIAIQNMDTRIAELRKSKIESQKAIAAKLQKLRDSLNDSLGESPTDARTLRDIQTDYQRTAYGKALDPDGTANLAAHNEAQKAVGDAVFEHVTGLDYEGARAAAAENPDGMAARLLKANEKINAANKIEAGITDRAGRPQPKEGIVGKAEKLAHVVAHPTKLIPGVADVAARGADRVITTGSDAARRLLERAQGAGRAAGAGAAGENDLSYAAKVAAAMKSGMSLQDAVNAASN